MEMTLVVRKTQTKRKKATPLPRKIRTGIAAAPTKSFFWFADYLRTDVEKKEIGDLLRSYIKENYKGAERTLLLGAPEYYYSSEAGTAATIQWKKLGYEWPDRWDGYKKIHNYIERTREAAIRKLTEKDDSDKPVVVTKSAMEVVKERTSDFIANVESILDDWENQSEYSLYNEMIKSDLNSFSAKHVLDYYIPIQKEIEELVNKKTEDLVEAYSYMSVPTRKKYLAFVQNLVNDAERYVLLKKVARKPSKPRVKTADKQVTNLTYAKESAEFKITSINPTSIIGASRVYTFNVKSRIITEYVSERTSGFEVRGSTIYGISAERSRSIRLRKPEEQLSTFLTKTPTVIGKFWEALTTKTIDEVSGRINKDTILLRALDK
jgi:hypothetical protein